MSSTSSRRSASPKTGTEASRIPLGAFGAAHARTLQAVLDGPQWQAALADGSLRRARERLLAPPPTANVFSLPVDQLQAINGPRVQALIAAGERDPERLLEVLGTWPEVWPAEAPVRLSFLGLCLTFRCDMTPKCIYCNQQPVPERLGAAAWRAILESLRPSAGPGTYVYLTGGEPLLLREKLWGVRGLIRAATRAGAACNINTNALRLGPRAVLGLVSAGLGRIHVSLDSDQPSVQDALRGGAGRWAQALRGLHNLQIAKALLGTSHPVIHLNCVLTTRSAWVFPDFLRFVLGMKPLVKGAISPDLDMHLIPVGGEQNRPLRLTSQEYERFYTATWEDANVVWLAYQRRRRVPADQQGSLQQKVPFMSPFHRVQQQGDLAAWAQRAAEGRPADLALSRRCYVGPTQAFVLPDGSQYWCGGHAVARPVPVGNVTDAPVADSIRHGLAQIGDLPGAQCRGCPGATQAINQTVEARLRQTIAEWLGEPAVEGSTASPAHFEGPTPGVG